MTRQERQKKYNDKFRQEHPEYVNEWVKKRYRTNMEYQKQVKYHQKKNYWRHQGYDYEQYDIMSDWCNAEVIEHIKDYIWEAEEFKITRIKNGWSLEIKTKINNK